VRAHGIAVVDTVKDQPEGVLGFHTEDQGGKLWGVVAAKPKLDNGGHATTGDWSVSSVLSHEVLEMFVDPNCNLWANNGTGAVYSFEVCDPVEAPTYVIEGVSVSNFVTPAWFDPLSSKAAQFDKLKKLQTPFSLLKGGYQVYAQSGKESCWPAWGCAHDPDGLSTVIDVEAYGHRAESGAMDRRHRARRPCPSGGRGPAPWPFAPRWPTAEERDDELPGHRHRRWRASEGGSATEEPIKAPISGDPPPCC
jgi:hypothetical protein